MRYEPRGGEKEKEVKDAQRLSSHRDELLMGEASRGTLLSPGKKESELRGADGLVRVGGRFDTASKLFEFS